MSTLKTYSCLFLTHKNLWDILICAQIKYPNTLKMCEKWTFSWVQWLCGTIPHTLYLSTSSEVEEWIFGYKDFLCQIKDTVFFLTTILLLEKFLNNIFSWNPQNNSSKSNTPHCVLILITFILNIQE